MKIACLRIVLRACTCLTITCTCSSTSHDPTGNYFQGDVKADSAGTIVWL